MGDTDFLNFYSWYFIPDVLTTITGNLLIIIAVIFDQHLYTPMYFFMINLAIQDIDWVSFVIPKPVLHFLTNIRYIFFYSRCVSQVLLFTFSWPLSLLTVMAYDQCIAICNPLQYEMTMNRKACTKMVGSAWTASFLNAILHIYATFTIPFCSNVIKQFYCEIPYLHKIACSGLHVIEIWIIMYSSTVRFGCFVFDIKIFLGKSQENYR